MKKIRIVLADDHALVRSGLRALLGGIPGVEVVGDTGEGREALSLVERLQPDIILMDITVPGLNSLEDISRLAKDTPHVKVLLLSAHASEEYVLRALRGGVAGYVLKTAPVAELELAVRAVTRGETYLSPALSRPLERNPLEELTGRQREILQLIAEGHTAREIAARLGLAVTTVETHRSELMERLDIHDVSGLVRFAIRMGLVTPDP